MSIPVYRIITDDLLRAITDGRLKPGDRIASIRELSAQYHVSQITVLRVFKELVLAGKIVRREGTGYYVKENGPVEKKGNTLILACRFPRPLPEDDRFILRLTEGIQTRTLEEGFNLFVPRTIATVRMPVIDAAHMESLLRDLQEVPHPAGIILDMLYPDEMIAKYILPKLDGLPCVIAGRRSSLPVRTVSLPFEKAADDAAALAEKSGAEEFFIYEHRINPWGGNDILCKRFRENLIRAGVSPKNIHYRNDILQTMQNDLRMVNELKEKILHSEHKILAFSSSDYFSQWIMQDLHADCQFGTRASLISFGGFEMMMKNDPPVTSIVPNARQIGVLAVELMMKNDMASYVGNLTADCRIELNSTL